MNQRPPLLPLAAAIAALAAALLLVACASDSGPAAAPISSPTPAGADQPVRVGVTLPLFADFAREVGRDKVDVFSILPTGADPHTYEATPSDLRRIAEADIMFVNSLEPGVEGSILDVIRNNKGGDATVIPFMANVVSPRAQELGDAGLTAADAGDDPHLWLDPSLARAYAAVIAETFIARDGPNAALYSDNLAEYGRRLSQLDEDIAAALAEIPLENRKLVTSHNAFAHLARRYDLDLVGFVVPGPGQEPSSRDIADLTRAIEDEAVPAVFIEPQVGPQSRLLEQMAADAGVLVCTLYSDSFSDEVLTYVDMMRFNGDELLRCLGGGYG